MTQPAVPLPAQQDGDGAREPRPAPLKTDGGRNEIAEPAADDRSRVVDDLKARLADPNVRVTFVEVKGADTPVIRVVNRETGEVLRQIPPQEVLELRQRFTEFMGLIQERKA